jgi:hypothetical protein
MVGRVLSFYEKQVAEAGKDDVYFRLPAKSRESSLELHFENGSRIIGLPASEGKIRVCSSVALLLIDEASRVDDSRRNRSSLLRFSGAVGCRGRRAVALLAPRAFLATMLLKGVESLGPLARPFSCHRASTLLHRSDWDFFASEAGGQRCPNDFERVPSPL